MLFAVMAGLVPAIHVFVKRKKVVDARHPSTPRASTGFFGARPP
jgi:hypothetical protein